MDSTIARALTDASENGYITTGALAIMLDQRGVDVARLTWRESCTERGQLYIEILTPPRNPLQVFWSATGMPDAARLGRQAARMTEALRVQLHNAGRECATSYDGPSGEDDPKATAGTIDGLTRDEARDFARRLKSIRIPASRRDA